MRCWWERKKNVKYTGHTKHEIEDTTGSVPLLLDGCIVHGEIELSALPLVIVSEQVLQFMEVQRREISRIPSR